MSRSMLYDIISNVDNISNDIPDKIIDSFADCNNWSLKIRHGVAILSFLMENDQLADLDQDVDQWGNYLLQQKYLPVEQRAPGCLQ